MKSLAILVLCFLILGCANGRVTIRDQEFLDHKTELEALESQYLKKQITYAEYLEQKEQIEQKYDRTIQQREDDLYNAR